LIRINLLPQEARRQPGISSQTLSWVLVAFLIVSTLSSLYAARLAAIHRAELELRRLEEEVEYYSAFQPEVSRLRSALKQAQEEYAEVSMLDEGNAPFWVLLAKTSQLVPEAAWIERFEIAANGSVSIDGNALSYAAVADTLKQFDEDSLFSTAQLRTAYVFDLVPGMGRYAVGFQMGTSVVRGGGLDGAAGQ
jgi:Tfp pilus assembly protein PilN